MKWLGVLISWAVLKNTPWKGCVTQKNSFSVTKADKIIIICFKLQMEYVASYAISLQQHISNLLFSIITAFIFLLIFMLFLFPRSPPLVSQFMQEVH